MRICSWWQAGVEAPNSSLVQGSTVQFLNSLYASYVSGTVKIIAQVYELVPTHLQGGMMQKVFTLGCVALIHCIKLFLSQKQHKTGHEDGDVQTVSLIWRQSFSLSQESMSNSLGLSEGLSGYIRTERNVNVSDNDARSFASNDLWLCLAILDISIINVNPSKLNRCF